jgi:hypothetical protein
VYHPGLQFLQDTHEFQEKYSRTVIARIFFALDCSAKQEIDLRAVRRSNLVAAFNQVDIEEDINSVNDYFSYEVGPRICGWGRRGLPLMHDNDES